MQSALLFFSAFLIALSPPSVVATDYFVSPSGDDSTGDGSQANPWRTITRAVQASSPGDSVHVAAGDYKAGMGEIFPVVLDGVSVIGPSSDPAARVGTYQNKTVFRLTGAPSTITNMTIIKTAPDRPAIELQGGNQAVLNNSIVSQAYGVEAVFGSGASSMVIEGNSITTPAPGNAVPELTIGVLARQFHSSNVLRIRDNQISDMATGVSVGARGRVEILDNRILRSEQDGLVVHGSSRDESLQLERNTIRNSGGDGMNLRWYAYSSDVVIEDPIRFNSITGSGRAGLRIWMILDHSDYWFPDPATIEFAIPLYGNTIAGNQGEGVLVSTVRYYASLTQYDEAKAPTLTLNTIQGNGLCDLHVASRAAEDRGVLCAQENWWGTVDLSHIEDHVCHRPDYADPLTYLVDFSLPLAEVLEFQPTPTVARRQGGDRVTVTALPGSAFVPIAGHRSIDVTLDGLPVLDLQVGDDGRSLTFTTPPLSGPGPVLLSITNPANQTGTALMQVKAIGPFLIDGPLSTP